MNELDKDVIDTLQGLSKFGILGEVSIDFADYALATKLASLSIPLKNTKFEAVLNVSSHCSLHHRTFTLVTLIFHCMNNLSD